MEPTHGTAAEPIVALVPAEVLGPSARGVRFTATPGATAPAGEAGGSRSAQPCFASAEDWSATAFAVPAESPLVPLAAAELHLPEAQGRACALSPAGSSGSGRPGAAGRA